MNARKPLFAFFLFFFLQSAAQASIDLRVALGIRLDSFTVSCAEGLEVRLPRGRRVFSGTVARFETDGERIFVNGNGIDADEIAVRPFGPFVFNKRSYRGLLQVSLDGRSLDAVNFVNLEKYLYSVVGSEMPSHWPLEALKAQAVVARTYALKKMEEKKDSPFDLMSSAKDQMYGGMENETSFTRKAVEATRGIVVTYGGDFITAYYHADCGGRTEDGDKVFKGDFPYLKSVVCPFGKDSPYRLWEKTLTLSDLSERLGVNVDGLRVSRDPRTQRVSTVTLSTSSGPVSITGHFFRRLLGLREIRSTNFDVQFAQRAKYVSKASPSAGISELNPAAQLCIIYGNGALSQTTVTRQDPFVVLSEDGFISTAYQKLVAVYEKTKLMFGKIFHARTLQKGGGEKVSRMPVRVPGVYTFMGSGWGHGVGMCQWGARGMALMGKDFQDILHYYYTGVQIRQIGE